MSTQQASLDPRGTLGFSRPGFSHALRRVATVIVFAVLPCALLLLIVVGSAGNHFAFDFHQFWQGGRDVAHGHSPYPRLASLPPADVDLTPVAIQHVFRFPYPAPAALAMVPFGLLPFDVAAAIFVVCSALAVFVGLRLPR